MSSGDIGVDVDTGKGQEDTMRGKYVMTAKGPILFSESFKHSDFKDFRPTSAGFFETDTHVVVETWGESVSLRMKVEEADAELIRIALQV